MANGRGRHILMVGCSSVSPAAAVLLAIAQDQETLRLRSAPAALHEYLPSMMHTTEPRLLQLTCDPSPFRTLTHRIPACGRRPHGDIQLAVRAPARRRLRASHRGYRRGAILPRNGRRDSRGDAVARSRLGRRARNRRPFGAVLPVRATRSVSRHGPAPGRQRTRVFLLLYRRRIAGETRTDGEARRDVAIRSCVQRVDPRRGRRSRTQPRPSRDPVPGASNHHALRRSRARHD